MKNWIVSGIILLLFCTFCEKDGFFNEQHKVTYKIIIYNFDEDLKFKLGDPSGSYRVINETGMSEFSIHKATGETCFMEVACSIRDERVEFIMQILVNDVEMKSFH